ncbi:MAG: SRPBCC family protein [Elusimicrobia bacterium]|nr:SRPBCC family protein [Elusimicrobiota bacterium]
MTARGLSLLGILALARPAAGFALAVDVESTAPRTYTVRGAFDVAASPQSAWEVLTDYDGLAAFVDDLRSSRVRERGPQGLLLEQEAVGRFFFLRRKARVVLRVRETAESRIEFEDVLGEDFVRYRGAWTIEAGPEGARVRYELEARPSGPALGAFARKALLDGARDLLDQVRLEILRRSPIK